MSSHIYVPEDDFQAVGDGAANDTQAMINFWLAVRNGRGRLIGRYRSTQSIVLDPAAMYNVEGDCISATTDKGSWIFNDGTGPALSLADPNNVGNNNEVWLRNFGVRGSQTSGDGLSFNNIHGLRLEKLFVLNNGGCGIRAVNCASARFDDCTVVHNWQHGLFLYQQANDVSVSGGRYSDNSRQPGGYANIAVQAPAGLESLEVNFQGVDFSGAPVGSFGLVLQRVYAAAVRSCYCEAADTLLYADPTAFGIVVEGNYFQDGKINFDGANSVLALRNVLNQVTAPTSMVGSAGDNQCKADSSIRLGGATQSLAGYAAG